MQKFTSLYVQRAYVALIGILLIIKPNALLGLFGLDPAIHVYIRVLGVLAVGLAIVYDGIIKARNIEVIISTIYGRYFTTVGILGLTLLGFSQYTLALFAIPDFLTATWTWYELKKA
jgi:hypothetical protein